MAKALSWVAFALLLGGGQTILSVSPAEGQAGLPVLHWFKGNTHTHTLESDGDSSPEDVVRWYREHGYDFLVITDHDQITPLETEGILLIPGEEVTDRLPKKPLHVNAIGLQSVVKPQGGSSIVDVLQRNVNAVRAAGGVPAINHPNFGWAFGADELKQLDHVALVEIASGHPFVNMLGGGGVPSVEAMWDQVLTSGRRMFGIGVDDAHHLVCSPPPHPALPGQAWIVVRAETLTQPAILTALERGDFYASTGVEITDFVTTPEAITITIREGGTAKFQTQFIGRGGKVLQTSIANPATYRIRGNEMYVRAKVTDSNGKHAWLQPVWVRR